MSGPTIAPPPAARNTTAARPTIEPCRNDAELRAYIDAHWRRNHVLARDGRMFDFQYRTPWVDRQVFPRGTSVLCAYDDEGAAGEAGRLVGFLGAIVAPYPRPRSFWLALWHVLPDLKGCGLGGRLLGSMQTLAENACGGGGWIGTFGAGPEAVPVYLKRGYAVRAVRRWVFEPGSSDAGPPEAAWAAPCGGYAPDSDWLAYRYDGHPIYRYERRDAGVFRTETNTWGVVTHCLRISAGRQGAEEAAAVWARDRARAEQLGMPHLMDAWSFETPGPGWTLAREDLPSVFHPPEARGNLIYASGRPVLPSMVTKGDCDQDRPN